MLQDKTIANNRYHSQTNGTLERSHRVLADYLRHFSTTEKEWDEWTNYAMFSYNTSVYEATQFTPFELLYGKIATAPSNFSQNKLKIYHDRVTMLVTKLQDIRHLAREHLIKAKEKSKKYYDKRKSKREIRRSLYKALSY